MEITEIRIKLMDDAGDRLQAFCSITFDGCFVIRDLKIIQGTRGSFVAMPSRKLTDRCPRCGTKNHLRARYCNECGARLQEERAFKSEDGRAKLYADIAHPINSECRDLLQRKVLEAYAEELERSKLPGYVCTYDDYDEESFAALNEESEAVLEMPAVIPVSGNHCRRDAAAAPNGYQRPLTLADPTPGGVPPGRFDPDDYSRHHRPTVDYSGQDPR
ncbi:MAG: SpoVG family protein [Chloroflexi bacterium]|nr:SpoVG family protein [Chloroflexota bacterium]